MSIDWIVTTEAAPVIPPGYAVAVTRAVFDGAGFAVDLDGCGPDAGSGRPNCLGHVMRPDTDACELGVRALPDADPGAVVGVRLAGILSCPPNAGAKACERFARAVAAEPGVTIPLDPPPAPTPPANGSATTQSLATEGPASEDSVSSSPERADASETPTSEKSGSVEVPGRTGTGTAP